MEALKAEARKIQEEVEEVCNQAADHAVDLMFEDRGLEYEAQELIKRDMWLEEEIELIANERKAINLAWYGGQDPDLHLPRLPHHLLGLRHHS